MRFFILNEYAYTGNGEMESENLQILWSHRAWTPQIALQCWREKAAFDSVEQFHDGFVWWANIITTLQQPAEKWQKDVAREGPKAVAMDRNQFHLLPLIETVFRAMK